MANKCYASTMLPLRIAVLARAKAVGWSISCAISHVREMTIIVCWRAEKRTRSSPQAN